MKKRDAIEVIIIFYILIREGIRFMQNGTPPFLSNVHVLRPSEPEKMVFAHLSVCLSIDFSLLARYF